MVRDPYSRESEREDRFDMAVEEAAMKLSSKYKEERDNLIGIVVDLAAWSEFNCLDIYDLGDYAAYLMDKIAPDWRMDYEESSDE